MKTLDRIIAASLAATLAITSAQAGILGFGTRESSFLPAPGPPSLVPLQANGATTVTFRTARDNTVVAVTYNAECAAVSGHLGDYLDVWIAVDGLTQAQGFSFCSAPVIGQRVYVSASRRAVIRVPRAGLHTVRVFAKVSDGGSYGRLDDSSIVVEE